MKKQLAIFGLFLFIAGTIFMPAIHRFSLAYADRECGSHCGCTHHSSGEHEHDTPAHRHDSSSCAICQIAMMPADIPDITVAISATLLEEFIESPALVSFEYILPRLIPYSCGPPA